MFYNIQRCVENVCKNIEAFKATAEETEKKENAAISPTSPSEMSIEIPINTENADEKNGEN